MKNAFKKTLGILTLFTTLAFGSSKKANADIISDINLFPNNPFYRSVMVDSDIPQSEIKVPLGLEKELLEKPIKEILPYVSLAKTLPLISVDVISKELLPIIPKEVAEHAKVKSFRQGRTLSDKTISASLIASGELSFPKEEEKDIDYKTRLELFLRSPMIDDYLSDGNKLYIVGGYNGEGSIKLEDLFNKNLNSVSKSFTDRYSFFTDAYIVAKSPYSEQFLIVRAGINNLFSSTHKKSNFYFSTMFEFPSLLSWSKMFDNFKISPYVSTYLKFPANPEANPKLLGQLGIKAKGESGKSLILYGDRKSVV